MEFFAKIRQPRPWALAQVAHVWPAKGGGRRHPPPQTLAAPIPLSLFSLPQATTPSSSWRRPSFPWRRPPPLVLPFLPLVSLLPVLAKEGEGSLRAGWPKGRKDEGEEGDLLQRSFIVFLGSSRVTDAVLRCLISSKCEFD